MTPLWQLKTPISAVMFDCDGTLTTIEGIDELARSREVAEKVALLTETAMTTTGMNLELYQQRLQLVLPHQEQIIALGKDYFDHRVPDAEQVIQVFQRLNKAIYIISAGLYPSVAFFGNKLNIPRENIFAVDIQFDQQGNFADFDRMSPLVNRDGKRIIVNEVKKRYPELMYVGDGLNDYEVYDLTTRFVGFGGAFYRENIASRCQYYIKKLSMTPLLPLALTAVECGQLHPAEQALYQQGLALIHNRDVITE